MLSIMTTASPRTQPVELASQLRMAVLRLSRRLRQHAPEDITPSQLSALAVLVREPRLTVSQLADAERVQPPTITRVVDSLVGKGLVTRTTSVTDRRVAYIEPTREGRALVETTRKQRDAYLARHLRALSPDDLALLHRAAALLERLTEDPEP
jgi:DNA-binding MarR family transcriptional regulator